jgi:murein DD-endopeptidase MepM/ murein hydrolase activator NlpD
MKPFSKALKIILLVVGTLFIVLAVFFFYTTQVTSNLDTVEYQLPYAIGTSHRVVQGYGGLFSHLHIAAIDFEMPVGTPVYAARAGTIFSYKDNGDEGGPFPRYKNKANYIIIQHNDGSFGCYWHLQKNGVLVKSGHVTTGQQIGISGATGQVLRPHLHFSVKRQLNYQMNSFVKTKFNTTNGIILLTAGATYERPLFPAALNAH